MYIFPDHSHIIGIPIFFRKAELHDTTLSAELGRKCYKTMSKENYPP